MLGYIRLNEFIVFALGEGLLDEVAVCLVDVERQGVAVRPRIEADDRPVLVHEVHGALLYGQCVLDEFDHSVVSLDNCFEFSSKFGVH